MPLSTAACRTIICRAPGKSHKAMHMQSTRQTLSKHATGIAADQQSVLTLPHTFLDCSSWLRVICKQHSVVTTLGWSNMMLTSASFITRTTLSADWCARSLRATGVPLYKPAARATDEGLDKCSRVNRQVQQQMKQSNQSYRPVCLHAYSKHPSSTTSGAVTQTCSSYEQYGTTFHLRILVAHTCITASQRLCGQT